MRDKTNTAAGRSALRPVIRIACITACFRACLVRGLTLPERKGEALSDIRPPKETRRAAVRRTLPLLPQKRRRAGGFCLFCFILLAVSLCLPALAASAPHSFLRESAAGAASETLSGQFPETDTAEWLSRLREAIPQGVAGQIALQTPDDASTLVGVPHFFSLLADSLTDGLPSAFGAFSAFCGLALLGCLVSLVGEGVSSPGLQKGVNVLSSVALTVAVYRLLQTPVASAFSTLSDLHGFSEALLPVTVGIYTAGGNYSAAMTHGTTVGTSLSLQAQLTEVLLSPLVSACFAFALIASFGEEGDTDGLAASVRRIYMTILGVTTAVFSASLALQTAVSAASDSVAMRCARYAVGQMIPGVGSAVSGALSTVASSLSLVKNTVGVGGIGVIFMILVSPAVEIYLHSLALSLASAFCGLLGYTSGKKLFLRFKGICDMLLGTLCLSAVMSVLALAVFMKCGTAFA